MEPKTILKAEIRNIEIHVIQLSERGYQCTWKAKSDKPIQVLITDELKRKYGWVSRCIVNRPVSERTAMIRFRKLVRTAQDPRISFEAT